MAGAPLTRASCDPALDRRPNLRRRPASPPHLIFGAAAGDLALAHRARGEVYIAGGIAEKIKEFLMQSPVSPGPRFTGSRVRHRAYARYLRTASSFQSNPTPGT